MSRRQRPHSPAPQPDGPGATPAKPEAPTAPPPSLHSGGSVWTWVKKAYDNFSTIDGSLWSASFAYYAFFALFPLLLLFVILGTDVATRFVGPQEAQHQAFAWTVNKVETYMPLSSKDRDTIRHTIQEAVEARGGLGLVALLGLLWSSLGFFQALVGAINKAWGQQPLSWWKLPLKNLLMLAIVAGMLLLGVILPAILSIVAQTVAVFHVAGLPALLTLLTQLVPPLVLFLGFLFFYKLAPRRRTQTTFRTVWMPALFVTALLLSLQKLFVFYTTHITNFNAVYGSFGGVIALMLWTYLSGMVIIFGGCLCASFRTLNEPARTA